MKRQLSGDPQIQVRIQEAHALLDRLDKERTDVSECRFWLEMAEETFSRRLLRFFDFLGFRGFLHYSAYDVIWQAFNQIRHVLCQKAPNADLLAVALDIRNDLFYIADAEDRKRYQHDLHTFEETLRHHAAGLEPHKPRASHTMEEIRYELERLSRIFAYARATHWRKVNLLRTRLLVTAFILSALLIGGLWLLPLFLQVPDITYTHILAIVGFGALGGLVSAIMTMESLEVSTSAYYIQRTLLGLRPVIGASAGLILNLIQVSGILSIVPAGVNPKAAYLVVAFAAGFSERFFVSQVERVVDLGKKEKKIQETEHKGEQTKEAS